MKSLFDRSWIFALIALFIGSSSALAAPTKEELRKQFESRYPQIMQAKAEGDLGETSAGFIEAVKSAQGATAKLIESENADRRALYDLIAKEEGVSFEIVARRAAQRNFQKAKRGEYLKDNGTWRQK
jgi:uncharacterized protein YdbL (DUF1318 family)